MGLFGKIFGKEEKKESCCCEMEIVELSEGDTAAPCDCGDACAAPGTESTTLTVLGPGCKRCHQLHENAQAAASKADGSVDVEYVTDPVASRGGNHVHARAAREREGRLAGKGARAGRDCGAAIAVRRRREKECE